MKKNRLYPLSPLLLGLSCLVLWAGCSQRSGLEAQYISVKHSLLPKKANRFSQHSFSSYAPQIPDYLQETDQRTLYFLENYWNEESLKDSISTREAEEVLQQKATSYLSVLSSLASSGKSRSLLLYPLQQSRGKALKTLLSSFTEILSNPNSAYYSPGRYRQVLLWASHSSLLTWQEQQEMQEQLSQENSLYSVIEILSQERLRPLRKDSLCDPHNPLPPTLVP